MLNPNPLVGLASSDVMMVPVLMRIIAVMKSQTAVIIVMSVPVFHLMAVVCMKVSMLENDTESWRLIARSHLIQVGGEDKTIDFTFHDYTA